METSPPIQRLNLKKAVEELSQPVERMENEDEIMARLAGYSEWETLRGKLEQKIANLEDSTKVTGQTIGLIEDIELYGFKCMTKDLLVETIQDIINMVELPAKVIKKQKKDEQGETK